MPLTLVRSLMRSHIDHEVSVYNLASPTILRLLDPIYSAYSTLYRSVPCQLGIQPTWTSSEIPRVPPLVFAPLQVIIKLTEFPKSPTPTSVCLSHFDETISFQTLDSVRPIVQALITGWNLRIPLTTRYFSATCVIHVSWLYWNVSISSSLFHLMFLDSLISFSLTFASTSFHYLVTCIQTLLTTRSLGFG